MPEGDFNTGSFKTHHEAFVIQVPEGMTATIFKGQDYTGESRAITGPREVSFDSSKEEWSMQVRKAMEFEYTQQEN